MTKDRQSAFLNILRLVPRVYFKLSAVSGGLLKDSGVSPGQRSLMEDVYVGGPQSIGALAKMRPVAKQYVQKLVSDLTAMDMVTLRPNPDDRRSKLVNLTKTGRAALNEWHQSEMAMMRAFVSGLDSTEVLAAENLLSRLNDALQQQLTEDSSHQMENPK